MKSKFNLWGILTAVFVVLGIFSLSRTFSEMTHHTGTPKSIALHVASGVLWLAIAWVISRRRQKSGEGEIPPTELAASIQKKLGLPYKLVPDKVPPDALMRFFRRTRKEARGQFTPVLVPVEEALDRMLDGRAALPAPEAPQPEDGKAILDRRWRALFETEAEAENPPAELLGEMAGSREQVHFLSCQKEGGAPLETLMLRLPVTEGWQAPAFIPAGGEGGMPATGELLAVCGYWYEKYRAVPAAMGHNSMEFVIPKVIPREEAMEVAKEHYAFCPDRVRRDTRSGTIGELADGLWQSTVWYFKWYGENAPAAEPAPDPAPVPSQGEIKS